MRRIKLLLSLAVLLCSAVPALDAVTCSEDSPAAAAGLAMSHINQHHDHGYKFRLNSIQGKNYKQFDGGCDIELQLDFAETTCHVVNPKHFIECDIREEHQGAVIANCTVLMTVREDAAEVTKYKCLTQQALTASELIAQCPDCPTLVPLNNPKGVEGVMEALKKINENNETSHIYALKEVGRQQIGSVMGNMHSYLEFAIVETRCQKGTRITPQACKPLCPARASHALCRATVSYADGVGSVDCEYYPASNTTALGPGEQEPVCAPVHVGDHGPPPHARGPPPFAGAHGPPPHAGHGGSRLNDRGHGPPPHAGKGRPPLNDRGHGPPPHTGNGGPFPQHAGGHGHPPLRIPPFAFFESVTHCPGFLTARDPAIHPICPWPGPQH